MPSPRRDARPVSLINLPRDRALMMALGGPERMEDVRPSPGDTLRGRIAPRERSGAVVRPGPIGLVSDPVEVLYDRDREVVPPCRRPGLIMARAVTAGDRPAVHPGPGEVARPGIGSAVVDGRCGMGGMADDRRS